MELFWKFLNIDKQMSDLAFFLIKVVDLHDAILLKFEYVLLVFVKCFLSNKESFIAVTLSQFAVSVASCTGLYTVVGIYIY